jgi:hypothetical protein
MFDKTMIDQALTYMTADAAQAARPPAELPG